MFYGLDVQRAFIQVSGIDERGDERVRCRVAATIEAIAAFADSLNSEDEVVLEATFHTWAIWALLKEHVEKVIVANPLQVRAIAAAKIKTDRFPLTEAAASPKPAQPAYWDDGTSTVVHLAATPDATVACATDYDGLLTEASIPITATLATLADSRKASNSGGEK